jgi:hypothetical protein
VWIRSLLDRNVGARLARERLENRNYAAGPVAAWPNVLERVGQFPTLVYRFLRRANARPWRSTSLPRRRRNELPTGSGDRLLSEKERGGSYSSLVGFVSIRSSPQFTLLSLIRGVAEFLQRFPASLCRGKSRTLRCTVVHLSFVCEIEQLYRRHTRTSLLQVQLPKSQTAARVARLPTRRSLALPFQSKSQQRGTSGKRV